MDTLYLAFGLLWKRKLTNLTIILQVVFSVLALATLFDTLAGLRDNIGAINEIPVENAYVMTPFGYYDADTVFRAVSSMEEVESIGRAKWLNAVVSNTSCFVAGYSPSLTARYTPSLERGGWFSGDGLVENDIMQAVVSKELRLNIGERTEFEIDGATHRIQVIGILREPAQYYLPTSGAGAEYFSSDMVIKQHPVVLLQQNDRFPIDYDLWHTAKSEVLLVFLRQNANMSQQEVGGRMGRYGELTPMSSLISLYNRNSSEMLRASILLFILFLLLAVAGITSGNMIQHMRLSKQLTIYYLLGLSWKKNVVIEAIRAAVLLALSFVSVNLLMDEKFIALRHTTPSRHKMLLGIAFGYLLFMFLVFGFGNMIRLNRKDLSARIKELQQQG